MTPLLLRISIFFLLFSGVRTLVLGQENVLHTVYLIGDAGEPTIIGSPLGNVLRAQVATSGNTGTVIFLGDNVYPKGMPDITSPRRLQSEQTLHEQVRWVSGTGAQGIFVPGNHDWERGGPLGWSTILNQQRWLDSLHDESIQFLPRDGCPGPVVIPLAGNTVMVIIDTQWLLHPFDKPGEDSDCAAKMPAEVLAELTAIFQHNYNKRVIIAAHHPLITYGEHGGVFPFKSHLFPLTDVSNDLYIPLPVVGSIYPLYRKLFGNIQDVAHPRYKEFSGVIQNLMAAYPGSMYVAGHEHAFEYIKKGDSYFVVSGSGSKTTYVRKKKYAQFVKSANGFVKLKILRDGNVITEFWQADTEFPEGKIVFEDTIPSPSRIATAEEQTAHYVPDASSVKVAASQQYKAGKGRRKMLGANYRKEWSTPIDVDVFDIGAEHGGLKILQKGGGMQTRSLRLADSSGREYVLRSVEKYPENAVPEMLRKTFAQDLVQDQISAAHPYAAVVIPVLADAAGIYHTNPKLVYLPDDPRFGMYRHEFANTLALFEERPDGDWRDAGFFGNAKKIISTSKVLDKLADDNDNHVDEKFVLRCRLFDMLIGDWDRHDDQWRWAVFKDHNGDDIYRPIPRDRDQAFFVNEGTIPRIWSRRWALPKFEGFDENIDWPSGLSFNARYFDRSFLTELSLDDWMKTAEALKTSLTDDVIERAIRQWPPEIFALHGETIIKDLKARREHLAEYARDHYLFLANAVDIRGSDKRERFEIESEAGGRLKVQVFKINKEGEKGKKLYQRTFLPGETKEIRLYAMGGDDHIEFDGDFTSPIRVRVIGGDGNDVVDDDAKGLGTHVTMYDQPSGIEIKSGRVKDRTSPGSSVNVYNRRAFQYNRLAPLLYGNFNADDGLFVGGGFLFQNHGFRKDPFKQRHIVLASFAPRTNSYNLLYRGDFTKVFGRWNLELNLDVKEPNFVNNFFGWGNDSEFNKSIDEQPGIKVDNPIDFYRFRFEEIRAEAFVTRVLGAHGLFRIGPTFQRIEIEEPDGHDRYVDEYAASLPYNLYSEFTTYAGVRFGFSIDHRDDKVLTQRGITAKIESHLLKGVNNSAGDIEKLESSVSFYHTFHYPSRIIFAARIGGGMNNGNYEFYQAQVLDGKTELRGFRKTRFYGDSKLYANIEARIKLSSLRTYLFPASFGILVFNDAGRVWYNNESSSTWHNGWGGGIWFTPFNLTVVSVEAGHSKEGTLGYFRLGFLF